MFLSLIRIAIIASTIIIGSSFLAEGYQSSLARFSNYRTKKPKLPPSAMVLPANLRKQKSRKEKQFFSRDKGSSKDHGIVNGEFVETNRILLQRETMHGITYFPYGHPKVPVFIRQEKELNKKFILFQDPFLPPGEGYFVVLRRIPPRQNAQPHGSPFGVFPLLQPMGVEEGMRGGMYPVPHEVAYDAFHLYLSTNLHGAIDRLNVRRLAYRIRTKFSSRKDAHQKFEKKRRKLAHYRQRFSIPGWRGKRSVDSVNSRTKKKKRLIPKLKLIWNTKFGPCSISPVNITRIKLGLEAKKSNFVNGTEASKNSVNYDFEE